MSVSYVREALALFDDDLNVAGTNINVIRLRNTVTTDTAAYSTLESSWYMTVFGITTRTSRRKLRTIFYGC